MTSPDAVPFTDLTLYDVSPSDLVDRALLDAGLKMPQWQPLAGNTEVVLAEAYALVVAEVVFAINRIPDSVVEGLLGLLGVTRSLGTPPTATATFHVVAPTGYDLPAGTAVRLTLDNGDPLTFTLDNALTVAAGTSNVTGPVTADSATTDANGIPAGTALDLLTALPYVDSVTLATPVTAGQGPEDDTAWITRGSQRLGRLTSTLVTPDQFKAAALEHVEVFRAQAIDNWDGTGSNPGHVSVAVLSAAGTTLSTGVKAVIHDDLDSQAQANLAVHIIDPTITTVPVTATVMAKPGYDGPTVQANVTAALGAYLSASTWPWSGTVRRNELVAVIDGAEGVDYVAATSPTAPAADVSLTGAAPLAKLGTTTITVNLP